MIDINETTSCVVCEAGVILEELEKHLEPHNMTIPIDLGAKGSCQIGGIYSSVYFIFYFILFLFYFFYFYKLIFIFSFHFFILYFIVIKKEIFQQMLEGYII